MEAESRARQSDGKATQAITCLAHRGKGRREGRMEGEMVPSPK